MRALRSLLWFLVGVLLVAVPMLASAAYEWKCDGGPSVCKGAYNVTYGSAEAAKAGFIANYGAPVGSGSGNTIKDNGWQPGSPKAETGTSGSWTAGGSSSFTYNGSLGGVGYVYRYFACTPAGAGQPVGACGCQSGLVQEGGMCVQPGQCPVNMTKGADGLCHADCTAGRYVTDSANLTSTMAFSVWRTGQGSDIPGSSCEYGCQTSNSVEFGGKGSGSWYASMSMQTTGAQCSAGAVAPAPPPVPDVQTKTPKQESPEYKCAAAGMGFGTVNGQVVCTAPPEETVTKKKEVVTDSTTGQTKETTTTTTTNNTTNTTTTTTTTTTKDGSGNTVSTGTQTSTKTGAGAGNGEGSEGAGAFSGPDGELYKKGERTVAQALADFRATVEAAPIYTAAAGFFTVPNVGGACPVFTLPASDFNPAIPFDAHCGWGAYFEWAKVAILIAAAWVAFRWAML